jgi:hypothetical protein
MASRVWCCGSGGTGVLATGRLHDEAAWVEVTPNLPPILTQLAVGGRHMLRGYMDLTALLG